LGKKRSKPFKINSGIFADPKPIDAPKAVADSDNKIGVSLRYFQRKQECFSDWVKDDLKAFSNWVGKMSSRTEGQITANTGTCHAHQGKTKQLPSDVSPDVKMYNLDVGAKSRVHGFFLGSHFYLVWLDRNHAILKG
jgi:hypothetical protein